MADAIFGHSIFGDAVFTSSNPARPVWINSPPGPHPVPVGSNVVARQIAERYVPVSQVMHGRIPVPNVQPNYPGQAIPVGAVASVQQVVPRYFPVDRVSTGITPIGPQRVVYGRPFPEDKHFYRGRPGVFHRPPEIGAFRYERPHQFGPPVFSGYGANPDGLGAYDGLVGFSGFG